MRGNLPRSRHRANPRWSIPVCAGEPRIGGAPSKRKWVYPRVCGGTAVISAQGRSHAGLSPCVRGNRKPAELLPISERSIPVCAGEPTSIPQIQRFIKVYPRVCGGTRVGWRNLNDEWGLSPCVRGNPDRSSPNALSVRSIPVCAGEPRTSTGWYPRGMVYPRVCGGTARAWRARPNPCGLSPCVRGNPGLQLPLRRRRRSIPVCAGEPPSMSWSITSSAVYPRVCGGTQSMKSRTFQTRGLSPCVRGNPSLPLCQRHL